MPVIIFWGDVINYESTMMQNFSQQKRLIGGVASNIAIGAVGLVFDSLAGQIGHSIATDVMFFRSCVAQALSR